jgi:hypothetical protein
MSKRDSVLLISRAIAALELIAAFENILFLVRFFLNAHYFSGHFFNEGWWQQIAGQLATLAFQLIVACAFWRCGPGIANFLLPGSQQPMDSGQPA